MLAHVLKAVTEKVGLDKALVQDVVVGNVRHPGAGAGMWRMAQLKAGFPEASSIYAINRQCSSGIQAVANIAASIKTGMIDVGIAAGVESMGQNVGTAGDAKPPMAWINEAGPVQDCLLPMGLTSENVAKQYGVDRAKQDEFAFQSYQKAIKAQEAGLFKDEITPMHVTKADGTSHVADRDDGVRPTTKENLAKLCPAFAQDGFSTAGNSSQVSDGAAAVLLMRRSVAQKLGVPIVGKFVSFAVTGVPPKIMGVGPAYAIPAALEKAHINKDQVDIFEINEAFASQAIMSIETLGLDYKKVNPKGGAIAMGHPLGCTGARQVCTLLTELKRTGGKTGVISMVRPSNGAARAVSSTWAPRAQRVGQWIMWTNLISAWALGWELLPFWNFSKAGVRQLFLVQSRSI